MKRRFWPPVPTAFALALVLGTPAGAATNRPARISEGVQSLKTYAFSEPNPVPILVRDPRLYPYHSFEGYSHEGTPRDWKVVTLENDLIEVFVLPEIGGKVWGARVKKTGHEFIYRNEVVKFRNIALRGPWTSGGIEFNFGVIGHTPSTATPVDYALKTNPDGSVSCIVGTMDLPSRTQWRVEIRLPADKASFQTNVLWHNPTPLEQPYYNWMTAAAFARDDLEMAIPGNAYLTHPGARESWPKDERGRFLPLYRNNTFGSNKSFHVVGELKEFFGGYYRDAGYGFGHWARHEEMPGQKLWLWALSRAGGIWEDLLTDTDGQYVEYQAGRLLVQFTPDDHVNPITQAGFDPLATDRWTEEWFPLEGLGGLTTASRDAAISVREENGRLRIGVNAFGNATDVLRVWSGGALVLERPLTLAPLEPFTTDVPHTAGAAYRVALRGLGVDHSSDPSTRTLSRPFETDANTFPSIPEADRVVFEAKELVQGRRFDLARPMLEKALAKSPWHLGALLALGDLEYRRARYREGLEPIVRALRLDAYDAEANFIAGNLYRALGKTADARDAFGWAARSLAYRTAANVQLAELALLRADLAEAHRYARIAIDYNRFNLSAWEILAVVGRLRGDPSQAATALAQLRELDPLNHLVSAEAYLARPTKDTLAGFMGGLRSEFNDQTILELAIGYANRSQPKDAITLLEAGIAAMPNPLLRAWLAYLKRDPAILNGARDVALVFPYRLETLDVLAWATQQSRDWTWTYLLALNLWSFDRTPEAERLLTPLGSMPDTAAFYVSRAFLVEKAGGDPEPDLKLAEARAAGDRTVLIPLIQHYQKHKRWADSLAASARARRQFPSDFNLALLHVRALVHLERADEALSLLNATRVLPSEHAREAHSMYAQARVFAALAAYSARRFEDAERHLSAALEWPEHLGQGKPYDPEERLVRFLLGRVAERRGRPKEARAYFEAVIAATGKSSGEPLDALAIAARQSLAGGGSASPPVSPPATGDVDSMLLARALSLRAR
jgi:tetratricopeptide (TPR) repeat protein